jgi:general secretion pathway protein D
MPLAGRTGGTSGASTVSATLGESNPLFGALRVMPIERLNSILVVTPRAAYLEEARRWIEKLDQPSDGGSEPQLYIYRVQNGNARHLASVLSGIFGSPASGTQGATGVAPGLGSTVGATQGQYGSTGAFGGTSAYGGTNLFGSTSTSGFGGSSFGRTSNTFPQQNRLNQQTGTQPPATAQLGGVRVMADDLNNTILVWATKAEFDKIEATLKRLDLPPTQVLIEASIIEVTLNDDLNYGLQWAFDGATRGGYQGAGQLGAGGIKAGTGSLADSAAKGFTYSLVNSAGQIRLALSALANKTKVKMISNPSLMVLDNHLAMMVVGNQVPVQSSVITGETSLITTSTVQYRDTGVNLAVTPSVNAGNLVTMQIDQTVTDTTDSGSSTANNQPIFLQRQISSKVAVRSGESIVLGGLIKDSQNFGKSGVPLLQDLPVLGNLFGSNTRSGARTELLVIITPKVVRTDPEIREVSEELRDRLRGLSDLGATQGRAPASVAPAVLPPQAP